MSSRYRQRIAAAWARVTVPLDGVAIDNVTEALERAKRNGVKNLVVQPTHLMNGYEYGDLVQELGTYADDFETIRIGDPLLTSDEDYAAVAAAMLAATAGFDGEKTAVCYMGHGTEAASNGVYDKTCFVRSC